MTEEIRVAQESAKAEIRALERWYNVRRSQIMQELERINNAYYEQTSEINTKWAQYISELCEVNPENIHKDNGPMTIDELATPDDKPSPDNSRSSPTGSSSGILPPTDDDLMAMESGIPRVDRPMTISELATEPVAPRNNVSPMTISELEMESEVNDDESVFSVYNPTPRGVANLDLSDDEYDEFDDEYHADHPSAVLYDERNRQMTLEEELEIHRGYDEAYSLGSEYDDIEHPYGHVAIVSDDEDDHPEENNNEDTEYDENAMEICS